MRTHTESFVAIARPTSMNLLRLHQMTLSVAMRSCPVKLRPSASPLKFIVRYSRWTELFDAFSLLRHPVASITAATISTPMNNLLI